MTISWQVPTRLALDSHDLHVWIIPIRKLYGKIKYYTSLLDPAEYKRFLSYKFEEDRKRFAITHGILRILLGRYLSIPPRDIEYKLNSYGKPEIAAACLKNKVIYFNLSHSYNYALIAVTSACEVGVDIEYVHTMRSHHEIIHRFFSKQEIANYRRLPSKERCTGFFRAWARKEAVIKALGVGLSCSLDSFAVDLSSDESLQEVVIDSPAALKQLKQTIFVFGFIPVRGFRAAVAYGSIKNKKLKFCFYNYI